MATVGLLLLQTPPVVLFVSVADVDKQIAEGPPIAGGKAGTVITSTVLNWLITPQLLVIVYTMVAVPGETPVTVPVAFTVATAGVAELQTPPVVALAKVVVAPAHTLTAVAGVMGEMEDGLTVIGKVEKLIPQIFDTVYVMFVDPTLTPNTKPVVLTEAMEPSPVLHVPDGVELERVVEKLTQTLDVPVIVDTVGIVMTVSSANAALWQPKILVTLYIIEVMPVEIPVTTPVALLMDAMLGLVLNQKPPVVALLKVCEPVTHCVVIPVIAPTVGAGLMVTTTTVVSDIVPLLTTMVNESTPE